MKKNVTLKIISKQYVENLEPSGEAFRRNLELEDSIEIMTEGTLYSKNDATYIAYDEIEESGLQNTKTLLNLSDKALEIRRYGEDMDGNMDMTLEPGVLNITRFKVPQLVNLDLEVYTNSLKDELSEEGYGKISVDYKITFDSSYVRRTKLEVEVLPS